MFEPGLGRGDQASVMGFRDFALLIYGKRHPLLTTSFPAPQFAFLDLEEDTVYKRGEDLQDQFEEAVAADATFINTSKRRLYWAGSPSDASDLDATSGLDIQRISQMDPLFEMQIGDDPFIALRL